MSRHANTFGHAICLLTTLAIFCIHNSGCKREPANDDAVTTGESATSVSPSQTDHPADHPRLIPVDTQDDPQAPAALPKSYELIAYTKTEPVRLLSPAELRQPNIAKKLVAFQDGLLTAIELFHAKALAQCAYTEEEFERKLTGHAVSLVEMETVDDAFGLFSIRTADSEKWNRAATHLTARDGFRLFACQGNVYIEIQSSTTHITPPNVAEPLLKRILFSLPSADPPLLFRILPPAASGTTKTWHVRSMTALEEAEMPRLNSTPSTADQTRQHVLKKLIHADLKVLDERLELSGDRFISIATVATADHEHPNVIWLIQYPDPDKARHVFESYQQVLAQPVLEMDHNTLVAEPKGSYLMGSWAADQESVQKLLPTLQQALSE